MRTAKAVLSLLVSASLAAPASAQVSVAVSAAGSASALPRVQLAVSLAPAAALAMAPSGILAAAPSIFSAPAPVPAAAQAPAAAPAPAALAASPAASAPVPAAEAASAPAAAAPAAELAGAVLARSVPSAGGETSAPAAAASARWSWERFWSGAGSRRADAPAVDAADASASNPVPLPRPSARSTPAATRAAAAAALLAPVAYGAHSFLAHAGPYLEAGGLLAATYAATRGVNALVRRIAAKKGWEGNEVAAVRLVASVALWTGAAAGALTLGGASPQTMTAVFGAGGTILTLGTREVLGNLIQGVNFLITRPFVIGDRVQVDDQKGTVSDATLTSVVLKKDDGSVISVRYTTLASKPIRVFPAALPGESPLPAASRIPKFKGAAVAVFKNLDRRLLIAGAAAAVLLAAPSFVPVLAAGWAATAAHYALAGALLWLSHRTESSLAGALNVLAAKNGWSREASVIARLAVRASVWAFGGGAALRAIGVSWTILGAGVGLATLGVGPVLSNVIQGANFLISRPFVIGERVQIGDLAGTISDASLTMLRLKLDDGSFVNIHHSTLAATPVVVFGAYQPETTLRLALPSTPKFKGAAAAVWKALDRRVLIAGAAVAALIAAPSFLPVLAAGAAATAVHFSLAAAVAWLTHRIELALTSAVNRLAAENGWRPETAVIARLAVRATLWAFGAGTALRLIGLSWTALGASVGVTTLGVGLATNNIFGSIVQCGEELFSKRFKVGDRVQIGTFAGVVEDMTLNHVVINLGEGRHALVPYTVVRDATLVVTPAK